MTFELDAIEIDRIDFVRAGAVPSARILVAKSEDTVAGAAVQNDAPVEKSAKQLIAETQALIAEVQAERAAKPGQTTEPEPDEREAHYRELMANMPRPGERPHQFAARKQREAAKRVQEIAAEMNRRRETST